jgi:hypothetical protein
MRFPARVRNGSIANFATVGVNLGASDSSIVGHRRGSAEKK